MKRREEEYVERKVMEVQGKRRKGRPNRKWTPCMNGPGGGKLLKTLNRHRRGARCIEKEVNLVISPERE